MAFDDAVESVLELFQKNRVVLLGEQHGVAQNLKFVSDLIPYLHEAGIKNIALEFSAQEFQDQADVLVNSKFYDPQLARDFLFGYNVGWPYLDYQEVHHAIWRFNFGRQDPMRVVHPSYVFDWSKWTGDRSEFGMSGVMHRGNYNEFRAETISEAIGSTGKILGLFGAVHAFRDTRNLELINDQGFRSVGMLLEQNFGINVASVNLNGALDGFWDSELETSAQLSKCTIDYEFLRGRDFSEVIANWPDPDWSPVPKSEAEYWRTILDREA